MANSRDDRLESKIDTIVEKIASIDVTLGRQNVTLEEHMRRTDLLEKEVAPMKHKVSMAEGVIKFVAIAVGIAGLVELAARLMAP